MLKENTHKVKAIGSYIIIFIYNISISQGMEDYETGQLTKEISIIISKSYMI